MNDDELKRLLERYRPLDEIAPASALDGLIEAPAIILESSPFCRGYTGMFNEPRRLGTPAQISREGVKVYPIPASYDVRQLEEASAESKSIFASCQAEYSSMVAAMRERELEEQAADAMAFFQSLGDAPEPMGRVFETTNEDGGKVLFVMREPERLELKMPMSFDLPDPDPMRFILGQRLGGVVRRPIDRIITVTSTPMPSVEGVMAMLNDGWVWTGWSFARDQEPIMGFVDVRVVAVEDLPSGREVFVRVGPVGDPRVGQYRGDSDGGHAALVPGLRWGMIWGPEDARRGEIGRWGATATGRYASRLSDRRVIAGRYAERLPTNRKRKRERAKERRRERKKEARRATARRRMAQLSCESCGAHGVKMFRSTGFDIELKCELCLEAAGVARVGTRFEWWFPAIPTPHGGWWQHTCVPYDDACAWRSMPRSR